ncbi:MAG: hypothetical protein WD358_09265 [Nitriliruptoraceae bacterium]
MTGGVIDTARSRARKTAHASAISAYEQGAKQPRSDVLLRVLRAAEFEPMLVPASTGNGPYVDLFCDELATHVRREPAVLDKARHELDRMVSSAIVNAWRSLLDAGPIAVVAVLTSRHPPTTV